VRAQDITHVRLSPSPNANDPSATTRHGLGPQSSAAEASRAERTAPPQFTTQSASGSELEGDSPPEADPTMSRAARPRDALEASIAQDGIAHAPLTRSAPSATREPHLEVGEGPANAPRAATTADDANILPQQTPALHELRERVATTTRAGDDDSRLERASRAEHAHAASPERHAAASRDATAIAKAMPIESLRADEAPRPSALQAPSRREEHHATAELASARASLRTTAHAEIDLPDLGHVAVRADKRAGQVDVSVVARAEDAAALLQASRHDLAAHLRSADIRLGSLSVGSGGAGAPRDDRRQGGAPDRDATTGHDLDVSADGGAPHKRVRAVI
jgi:flagellar hook-length control protein FliK